MMRVGLGVLLCLSVAGCGTFGDCVGESGRGPRVYGGVQWDLGDQVGCVRVPFWYAVWDVPFSLITDTLLLPYTVFCTPRPQPESTP